eukprot:CAMPEP_0206424552 /NCGR_PEP_ID=MMETSP0324_2-20121206/3293_1 /ASSEMBLY_ACC=CAM_ASM_000836 /TAXON_ID=2866 /ORGANISM="Crypthecodinium cohnii, Strain Seligo" /LENGTH=261 /DNA_ID=CAMNT_0053889223 /DNA_START=173 /DNA_END=958 /DNA_ORIENTATION=+
MMTGNFFQLGYTIVYPKIDYDQDPSTKVPKNRLPDPDFYTAVIVSYFLGLLLYRWGEAKHPGKVGCIFGPLFALFVAVFEYITIDISNEDSYVGEGDRWIVCFLAPVFAVQNMLTMRSGLKVPTAFLTGHLQHLGMFAYEVCFGSVTRDDCKKHSISVLIIVFVVFGAFAGAAWDYFLGTTFALVPIAPMMAILFILHDWVFHQQARAPLLSADAEPGTEVEQASEETPARASASAPPPQPLESHHLAAREPLVQVEEGRQ